MNAALVNAPLWPSAHRDLADPARPGAVSVHWDHGVLHVRLKDPAAREYVDSAAVARGLQLRWF